jgi:hypothetical protein
LGKYKLVRMLSTGCAINVTYQIHQVVREYNRYTLRLDRILRLGAFALKLSIIHTSKPQPGQA